MDFDTPKWACQVVMVMLVIKELGHVIWSFFFKKKEQNRIFSCCCCWNSHWRSWSYPSVVAAGVAVAAVAVVVKTEEWLETQP